ncbi:Uncharacterised protein [[Ruminococcus] torques]|uniref:EpsG family protein n=1 Tax=[Ruminococcus] torques TaxID=33039 RepID=A0A564SP49_9FIRM|nr:EpsG family protein [[Ruminococcus] torques]VUW96841.1 Uncharacterised protein [[Ruminococcus] torques]
MAVYFALAAIVGLYGTAIHANTNQRRRKRFVIVAFALMILLAGLRSPSVGIDLRQHYARNFTIIASYAWSQLASFTTPYEIGYCYYTKFLTLISTDVQFYIFVTSFIIYAAIGYFIYKESTDVVMSTELVILSCLYYMFMNIIRQGMAVAIVLVGFVWLDYSRRNLKDYVKFAIMIILASTFHNSAILCMSIILFDRLKFTKKQILIGGAITALIYTFYMQIYVRVVGFFGSGNNYERYLTGSESVGNFNTQSLVNFLLAFFAFLLGYYVLVWKKKSVKNIFAEDVENEYWLEKSESTMLFLVLIASVCRLLLFRMNIMNRFTYYFIPFLYILYPYTIDKMTLRSNRLIMRALVYCVFALYFVWMTTSYASPFYGTVPFEFFWS